MLRYLVRQRDMSYEFYVFLKREEVVSCEEKLESDPLLRSCEEVGGCLSLSVGCLMQGAQSPIMRCVV